MWEHISGELTDLDSSDDDNVQAITNVNSSVGEELVGMPVTVKLLLSNLKQMMMMMWPWVVVF